MKILTTAIFAIIGLLSVAEIQQRKLHALIEIDQPITYLFYLHGQIAIENGKGVSAYWGVYEYQSILDTLSGFGYKVISEARPMDSDEKGFASKVSWQIDTLLKAGVSPARICVVGASAGAYIAMDIAERVKNEQVKYVIMGMCWPNTYKRYSGKELCGNFLSIYESSDPHGSCLKLLEDQHCKTGIEEIELNMNNSHGFLYKPYKEWINPMVNWINRN